MKITLVMIKLKMMLQRNLSKKRKKKLEYDLNSEENETVKNNSINRFFSTFEKKRAIQSNKKRGQCY